MWSGDKRGRGLVSSGRGLNLYPDHVEMGGNVGEEGRLTDQCTDHWEQPQRGMDVEKGLLTFPTASPGGVRPNAFRGTPSST